MSGKRTGRAMPRQSNIELLRIISMVMIVAAHFSLHGGFAFPTGTVTANRLWTQFILIGGAAGVNVFGLVSGYFSVASAGRKTGKLIRPWLQIFTYSVATFFLFAGLGLEPFRLTELAARFFPITSSQWWFASAYFVLCLAAPYINKLLNSMDQKMYQRFLVLLAFCWSIVPSLFSVSWQGNTFLWLVYLYSLGGYFRLYPAQNPAKGSTYLMISFFFVLLTFLSAVVFDIVGTRVPLIGRHAAFYCASIQRLPALLISVFLFAGFLKIDIGYRRAVNFIAPATFGVYLIHDSRSTRPLWRTFFKNASYAESDWLVPYSILVVAFVFAVCALIELVRIYALEKPCANAVDRAADLVDRYVEKFFSLKWFRNI